MVEVVEMGNITCHNMHIHLKRNLKFPVNQKNGVYMHMYWLHIYCGTMHNAMFFGALWLQNDIQKNLGFEFHLS